MPGASRAFVVRAALSLLLGAAAVFAWQYVFPSEETRIRRHLHRIVEEANEMSDDLSAVAAAARLTLHFTEDVTIDPGSGIAPIRGRENIMAIARGLRTDTRAGRFDAKDVHVTVGPDGRSAAVTLTATVTRDAGTSDESVDARDLALTMVKRESTWLISHVTSTDPSRF